MLLLLLLRGPARRRDIHLSPNTTCHPLRVLVRLIRPRRTPIRRLHHPHRPIPTTFTCSPRHPPFLRRNHSRLVNRHRRSRRNIPSLQHRLNIIPPFTPPPNNLIHPTHPILTSGHRKPLLMHLLTFIADMRLVIVFIPQLQMNQPLDFMCIRHLPSRCGCTTTSGILSR